MKLQDTIRKSSSLVAELLRPSSSFRIYLRKYRRFYAIGIASLIIVDTLEAIPPLLLKGAVDGLSEIPFGPALHAHLAKIVGFYMGIAIVQGAMRYLWRRYIVQTSMMASHDMRLELFDHLTELPSSFFQKRRVGDLLSLATNDIEAVRFALGPGALTLFDALFYFLVIPPIMFWISPELTLVSFVPLLLVPFFVRKMESKIQNRFRDVQDRFSHLASSCQEALAGVRIVKGSAIENVKEREAETLGQNYVTANMRAATSQAILNTGLESVLSASTTLLFLIGGAYVIQEKISLGVFVAFQRYVQKLQWPMEAIGLAANIFQRSLASQERIQEVLSIENPFANALSAENAILEQSIPEIEIRNLSFTYPGSSSPALQNISMKIAPGQRVGIAGGIGSGKSTLLQCLARSLSVESGTIFFNGSDINRTPVSDIRRKIAFVPQESFLFSRTVEENILYGSSFLEVSDKELRRAQARAAAQLANVDEDAIHLPDGYDTLLGERGTNISGGQRQRLTIARAIARGPKVLILDDCMSAIDAETEARLVNGILRASEGITMLIASHRISSFRNLDWLVLMENGRIIAQGKPGDLVQSHPTLVELERQEKLKEMDLFR